MSLEMMPGAGREPNGSGESERVASPGLSQLVLASHGRGRSRAARVIEAAFPLTMSSRPSEQRDGAVGGAVQGASKLKFASELMKRALDLSLGSVLLVFSAPIVIVAALAIAIESPGSPFFVQTRLGKNGKPFRILKLRGMYSDARQRFPELYDYSVDKGLDFYFHFADDPRVTRVGKFTRRTSIDELPNLWNVVVGDMSLVGPRPEIPEVLKLYGDYRAEYLSVKPGVTCVSKCTGRDRLTKRETIELDIGYIRTRGMRTDLGILWRTFCGVVLRRNVH